MRLVELKRVHPYRLDAVFEQDGERITKSIKLGDAQIACSANTDIELRYSLVRKAREAVRDFAFDKHGPEKWKEHVNWGEFFEAPTEEEKRMIEDAFAQEPD